MMKKIIVNAKFNEKKLIPFLQAQFPRLATSQIYKALRKKDICINDKRIHTNETIQTGDQITLYIKDEILYGKPLLDIVYEDEWILLLNKPDGIAVLENDSHTPSFSNYVSQYCSSAKPCHRLDRNTSGLILYAKQPASLEILEQKLKDREIDKYYEAIVYGIPKIKRKRMEAYLFKDQKKSMVYVTDHFQKGSKKIITSYQVLAINPSKNAALLAIHLETGRTHQIRAHLAHMGHPIIGDSKYGINQVNKAWKQTHQLLMSQRIVFSFTSDAGVLNYLNHKSFSLTTHYDKLLRNSNASPKTSR